jgi:Xaa-Pro aminopeptidase
VDGRYTLQVRDQVDTAVFEPVSVLETSVGEWLKANAADGARIGYDPWLMTRAQVRQIGKRLEGVAELVALDANPLDQVWTDRPPPPLAQVSAQSEALAGKTVTDKLAEIAGLVAEKRADTAVLTDPASVAWLFNIRGGDVPRTPLPLSFALVPAAGRPELFIDGRKLSNAIRDTLEASRMSARRATWPHDCGSWARRVRKVLYDAAGSAEAVAAIVEQAGGTIVEGGDPGRPAQGAQDRRRARREPRRASARWRGNAALPSLYRGERGRHSDRD